MPEVKAQPLDKLSMSRALGAAFLSHQVEQLERSVSEKDQARNRQSFGGRGRPRADSRSKRYKETRRSREENTAVIPDKPRNDRKEVDADVLITDASILIYGLSHLKRWSRDGREKIVVVPLEALNTLDSLKKGSTATARLARAASRFLEQQVGNNDRVRVQRDDAFVPWEELSNKSEVTDPEAAAPAGKDGEAPATEPAPEWLRRILCCVAFERKEFGKTHPDGKVFLATSTPPETGSPVYNPALKYDRASGTLIRSWANGISIPVITLEADAPAPPALSPKPLSREKPSMVEKPAATLAMENALVNTGNGPSSQEEGQGKVIRLLTRGSKLEP